MNLSTLINSFISKKWFYIKSNKNPSEYVNVINNAIIDLNVPIGFLNKEQSFKSKYMYKEGFWKMSYCKFKNKQGEVVTDWGLSSPATDLHMSNFTKILYQHQITRLVSSREGQYSCIKFIYTKNKITLKEFFNAHKIKHKIECSSIDWAKNKPLKNTEEYKNYYEKFI